MADKLSASQMSDFTERNIRTPVTRSLTLDSDSISLQTITDYVLNWGTLKTSVFNKHPADQGTLDFPLVTLELDNSGGEFNLGGTYFPGGLPDFESAVAVLTITISGTTFLEFTGAVLQPEFADSEIFRLVIEHPLAALPNRLWVRGDRIGGDTGIDYFFT